MKCQIVLVFLALGCQRPLHVPVAANAGRPLLQVPRAAHPPLLAQHDDDAIWQTAVTTGSWLQPHSREAARPYSNARLLWDSQDLYLCLYAADQNIEAHGARHDEPLTPLDAFSLQIQADLPDAPTFAVEIAPTGTVTDSVIRGGQPDRTWESGARLSMDMDGSLNDLRGEDDEEWVAFVALPWSRLGIQPAAGTRVRLAMARCDTPKDGVKRCGAWAQTVQLQ